MDMDFDPSCITNLYSTAIGGLVVVDMESKILLCEALPCMLMDRSMPSGQ